MKGISARLAMLVATAAVLPLLIYGLVSVRSLREGSRTSVVTGNLGLAARGAEQIEQYVANNVRTLQAVAAELGTTFPDPWQRERVLRNYVLTFPEFRELTLYDTTRQPLASSLLSATLRPMPDTSGVDARGIAISPIEIDDDLLPRTTVLVRAGSSEASTGWLTGELRLEEMWRLVDRLRVGERGYALLVDQNGRLIAHGDPDEKDRVARGEDVLSHPLARGLLRRDPNARRSVEYSDARGRQLLAVAAPLSSLGWGLILEQPTDEAYGLARRLEQFLKLAIGMALAFTVGLGWYWGRSFIRPITALMQGTKALSEGRLDTRVEVTGADEFRRLGDAFNTMADRLEVLQRETRRQERQAMFGRIAAGLVHDLAHPIQNIGNSCRLILKMHEDADYRDMFQRTVDREMQIVKRVLEDLRNLARPIPLERFPVDVGRSLGDVVESMKPSADAAGVALELAPPTEPLTIEGDVFALGRVYRNLVLNAIQATAPGGTITVRGERRGDRARITVSDTGCGIPPERLQAIFDDFVTTKRRGLGLGLALARKIVDQLGGTISVESQVGAGTTFAIEFPTKQPPAPAA